MELVTKSHTKIFNLESHDLLKKTLSKIVTEFSG